MYPLTHVYFAERVLGKISDEITLGSIFPDLIISKTLDHKTAHYSGQRIINLYQKSNRYLDFTKAVITHGIEPHGLDYYGDEKFLYYERGYCFEKGKSIIEETITACNIPSHMGWWKSHNIIEMGIELRISYLKPFGTAIRRALNNIALLENLDHHLKNIYPTGPLNLPQKANFFANYIELDAISVNSLAAKYNSQMKTKHNISVNQAGVARLIEKAYENVATDLESFFTYTVQKVGETLQSLRKRGQPEQIDRAQGLSESTGA